VLVRMREERAPTGNAELAHVPECASQSCWCSCSKDICAAVALSVADVRTPPSLAVVGPERTSSPIPYSSHFSRIPSVLCSEAVEAVASLYDLEGKVQRSVVIFCPPNEIYTRL
jgi:hypothetical protein